MYFESTTKEQQKKISKNPNSLFS